MTKAALMCPRDARAEEPRSLDVSVIVPTYASGEGLDGLFASLDAQSLDPSLWEVLFVDDNSPDDTLARLESYAQTRPHVKVMKGRGSGGPSEPRNIGIEEARGEFIAFLDHDDQLYPDALRAAVEFAREHNSDVVNGKESRTNDASWAIEVFRQDLPQAIGHTVLHPLVPTNPHKLYRRQLLMDHHIRFPGPGRVLWEDIFFNIDVAAHADVISTLSSVPYYYWVTTKGSGSTTFLRSRDEWWDWFEKVLVAADKTLGDAGLAEQRQQMLRHQYRSRLIDAFNAQYARRPDEEQERIFRRAYEIQRRSFLPQDDVALSQAGRRRAELLRAGAPEELRSLTIEDPNITGWGEATAIEWRAGALHVSGTANWITSDGRRHRYVRHADGGVRVELPSAISELLSPESLVEDTEIRSASAEFGARHRASRVTWMLPSESEVVVTDSHATTGSPQPVEFEVAVEGTFDPHHNQFGEPFDRGVWDLSLRCNFGGTGHQPRLRSTLAPRVYINDEGGVWSAYSTADGYLAVDVSRASRPVSEYLLVDPRRSVQVSLSDEHHVRRVRIPVWNLTAAGIATASCRPEIATKREPASTRAPEHEKRPHWHKDSATLQHDGRGGWIELALPQGVRRFAIRLNPGSAEDVDGMLVDVRTGKLLPLPARALWAKLAK